MTSTIDREFQNLLAIKNNFPKMLITMDNLFVGQSYQGIQHKHLREFLNEKI